MPSSRMAWNINFWGGSTCSIAFKWDVCSEKMLQIVRIFAKTFLLFCLVFITWQVYHAMNKYVWWSYVFRDTSSTIGQRKWLSRALFLNQFLPNKVTIATIEGAVKDLEKEEADKMSSQINIKLQNSKPRENLSKNAKNECKAF